MSEPTTDSRTAILHLLQGLFVEIWTLLGMIDENAVGTRIAWISVHPCSSA
jgi:hypothetical protein